MIFCLDDDDVEVLIETTFFIINHYWSFFDESSRLRCKELLQFLIDKYATMLVAYISKLPSFSHISELSEVEAKLSGLRKPVDSRTAFQLLAERVQHENSGVVLQALRELTSYLQRQQDYIQASAVSEQPDTVVPALTRALLDCASRYAGEQNEISQLCTQSIGLVGCLDPNRVETVREERHLVVLSNFDNHGETTDFVLRLLEDVLVKSFLAATDTKQQGLLSYAMQELLERCDIASAIRMAGSRDGTRDAERIYRKFISLPDETREVITPFLESRYRLGPMAQQQVDYPIFRQGRPYATWMRQFALDLLRRPQNPFSGLIFEPLCHVIRIKDLSTAEFLFPYLVLHVIISKEGNDEVGTDVLRELLTVLQHEVRDSASYIEREEKKLYYEVKVRPLYRTTTANQYRPSSGFLIMQCDGYNPCDLNRARMLWKPYACRGCNQSSTPSRLNSYQNVRWNAKLTRGPSSISSNIFVKSKPSRWAVARGNVCYRDSKKFIRRLTSLMAWREYLPT